MRIDPYDATSRFYNHFWAAWIVWWFIYATPGAILITAAIFLVASVTS